MISDAPFWSVARELSSRTDLDTWFPRGCGAPWAMISIIVIVILVQPREVRRAIADILRSLADLAWAVQELARAVLA